MVDFFSRSKLSYFMDEISVFLRFFIELFSRLSLSEDEMTLHYDPQ